MPLNMNIIGNNGTASLKNGITIDCKSSTNIDKNVPVYIKSAWKSMDNYYMSSIYEYSDMICMNGICVTALADSRSSTLIFRLIKNSNGMLNSNTVNISVATTPSSGNIKLFKITDKIGVISIYNSSKETSLISVFTLSTNSNITCNSWVSMSGNIIDICTIDSKSKIYVMLVDGKKLSIMTIENNTCVIKSTLSTNLRMYARNRLVYMKNANKLLYTYNDSDIFSSFSYTKSDNTLKLISTYKDDSTVRNTFISTSDNRYIHMVSVYLGADKFQQGLTSVYDTSTDQIYSSEINASIVFTTDDDLPIEFQAPDPIIIKCNNSLIEYIYNTYNPMDYSYDRYKTACTYHAILSIKQQMPSPLCKIDSMVYEYVKYEDIPGIIYGKLSGDDFNNMKAGLLENNLLILYYTLKDRSCSIWELIDITPIISTEPVSYDANGNNTIENGILVTASNVTPSSGKAYINGGF